MTKGNKFGIGGFQDLTRERNREIASMGGKAAHASGNARKWTSEEARAAALKGHANRKARKEAAETEAYEESMNETIARMGR